MWILFCRNSLPSLYGRYVVYSLYGWCNRCSLSLYLFLDKYVSFVNTKQISLYYSKKDICTICILQTIHSCCFSLNCYGDNSLFGGDTSLLPAIWPLVRIWHPWSTWYHLVFQYDKLMPVKGIVGNTSSDHVNQQCMRPHKNTYGINDPRFDFQVKVCI
jgi:hypothetical protein